jgi:hypothetical protein
MVCSLVNHSSYLKNNNKKKQKQKTCVSKCIKMNFCTPYLIYSFKKVFHIHCYCHCFIGFFPYNLISSSFHCHDLHNLWFPFHQSILFSFAYCFLFRAHALFYLGTNSAIHGMVWTYHIEGSMITAVFKNLIFLNLKFKHFRV